MLYTVIPIEQIYRGIKKEIEIKKEEKDIQILHGYVSVEKNGESYVVNRVISTDMKDYLNEMYFPGQTISSEIAPWDNSI